ncbi:MAG: CHAD domain-containing protein [Methylobacterium mesophilicum]|nr:CHAD domain-containing protein [Methylobacterium mesophilicum]
MAFKFKADDKNVQSGVRRIALDQIDTALAELGGSIEQEKAIHSVRKRSKRLRALLRLVRPSFDGYAHENAAIREAAQGLSQLRDAEVMGETFAAVEDELRQRLSKRKLDRFHQALDARAETMKSAVDREAALERFRAAFVELRARAEGWKLAHKDFAALRDGFETIYKRGRGDMRELSTHDDTETFHDWRKAVKGHFYHLCLMRDLAPHVLSGQRALANELGELLGLQHDMAVFRAALENENALFGNLEGRELLHDVLLGREQALGHQALRMGGELFVEKPKQLGARVERYWADWRKRGAESDGAGDRTQVSRPA